MKTLFFIQYLAIIIKNRLIWHIIPYPLVIVNKVHLSANHYLDYLILRKTGQTLYNLN